MSENNSIIKMSMLVIISLIMIAAIVVFYVRPYYLAKSLPKAVVIDTSHQPTIGNTNARLHFVAFEDLKCSNCARFTNEIFPYIQKHFINTGAAKYTFINLAFIQGSMPAANAAHCVYKQNKKLFFPWVDYIYKHQPPEDQNWATIPVLLDFANKIPGIHTDSLATCLVQRPYDQLIQNNLKQAAKLMPTAVATPTVYINGVVVHPLTKEQIDTVVAAVK